MAISVAKLEIRCEDSDSRQENPELIPTGLIHYDAEPWAMENLVPMVRERSNSQAAVSPEVSNDMLSR